MNAGRLIARRRSTRTNTHGGASGPCDRLSSSPTWPTKVVLPVPRAEQRRVRPRLEDERRPAGELAARDGIPRGEGVDREEGVQRHPVNPTCSSGQYIRAGHVCVGGLVRPEVRGDPATVRPGATENRVTPFGEPIAHPGRGLVYGNRGCLHDAAGRVRRYYNGRRWIACHSNSAVWKCVSAWSSLGRFTELFFSTTATALPPATGRARRAAGPIRPFPGHLRRPKVTGRAPTRWTAAARRAPSTILGRAQRHHAAAFAGLPTARSCSRREPPGS